MRRYLLPGGFDAAYLNPTTRLNLTGEDFHYLAHVLRYSLGSRFEAIDRQGRLYMAEIRKISSDSVEIELKSIHTTENEPSAIAGGTPEQGHNDQEYYLYQALLKGRKMESVIRQAAAAGIHHIIPLQSDHAVAKIETPQKEEKKRSRWNAVIKEAIQQSGSSTITRVHPTLDLQTVEKNWSNSTLGLFFHEVPLENGSLHRYLSSCPQRIALFIGPEGGFSDREIELLRSFSCRPVHLHTNVLRAETAAIYAIGAVQTIMGEKNQWKPVLQSPETTDTAESR